MRIVVGLVVISLAVAAVLISAGIWQRDLRVLRGGTSTAPWYVENGPLTIVIVVVVAAVVGSLLAIVVHFDRQSRE